MINDIAIASSCSNVLHLYFIHTACFNNFNTRSTMYENLMQGNISHTLTFLCSFMHYLSFISILCVVLVTGNIFFIFYMGGLLVLPLGTPDSFASYIRWPHLYLRNMPCFGGIVLSLRLPCALRGRIEEYSLAMIFYITTFFPLSRIPRVMINSSRIHLHGCNS